MRKVFGVAVIVLLFCTAGADAYTRGFPIINAQGKSVINLGDTVFNTAWLNVLKVTQAQFTGGATPAGAGLDGNFNPTSSSWTGTISLTLSSDGGQWSGSYLLIADAGWTGVLNASQVTGCASVSGSGITQTGNCSGVGNATFTMNGAGGIFQFSPAANSSLGFSFPGTGTYAAPSPSTATLAVVRNNGSCATPGSDCYNYQTYRNATINGAPDPRGVYTQEYLSYLASLHAATLRPMGDVNAGGNGNANTDVLWTYRTPVAHFTYGTGANGPTRFPPGVWSGGHGTVGTISHSTVASSGCTATGGSNELYTASATDDVPSPGAGPYTYGTVVQGSIPATNSTTSPQLCFGTGAYPIYVANQGAPPAIGGSGSLTSGIATFIFDPWINSGNGGWWYVSGGGGLVVSLPYEIMVGLANYLSMNLQLTIPCMADDNYVTQEASIALNLKPNLMFKPEYANEVWNSQFWCTKFATARGTAFGFTNTIQSWYGLRVRQIMGSLVPTVWSSRRVQLQRVLAYQAGSNSAVASNATNQFRLQGFDLAPSGTGTGTGNSVYNSFTTSANYLSSPNRPVDVVEEIDYAPYAGGANLFLGADIVGSNSNAPTASNTAFYQSLVNAVETGDNATAALLVDGDIRTGQILTQAVTCNGTTFTTPAAHGFPVGGFIAFNVTGGTQCAGLTTGALYKVTATSTTSCPGAVICNFTMQAFSQGSPAGANVSASAGTGSMTVGFVGGGSQSLNFQTMQALNSNWYFFGEALANQFDGRSNSWPAATGNLRIGQYEGNLEPLGPTQAQCNSIGVTTISPTTTFTATTTNNSATITGISSSLVNSLISGMVISGTNISGGPTISAINFGAGTAALSSNATGSGSVTLTATGTCATSIALGIVAWKNSASASATQQLYYQQFHGLDANMPTFGAMTHQGFPSQLVVIGTAKDPNNAASNAYGLLNGALPGTSPTFQMLNGIATYNTNWLLKRDLDPAANDNAPMFLSKVA